MPAFLGGMYLMSVLEVGLVSSHATEKQLSVFRLLCYHFPGHSAGIYEHAAFHRGPTTLQLFASILFAAFVASPLES
jgi:hypothetical protein